MGLDRFLSNFTKAEQDAIRGAIGNGTSKQIISGIIDDDIEEDASVKSAAKQVLNGIQDLSVKGLHKISTDSSVDEAIVEAAAELVESINDDDAVRAAKQAEFENRIKNLLVKAASEASDVIKEKEKDLEKSRGTYGSDRNTSSANRDPKSGNESAPNPNPGYATNDTNSGPSPKAGTEANPANGATSKETPMDREDEYDANDNKGESKVKETRQKAVGLGRQDTKKDNNLAFRRQLTEFYIFGEYGQKLADWYEQDKGRVPDPLDADSFIVYLRAVTDFLSRNGAFTYVSGINKDNRLTSGQEVWFDVEDSLTDANGVKVVVIKTLDSQDNEQVIGTIRTQYEFEAYDAAVEDGKQEKSKAIEAQRKLYEEVIRRHENGITDKVTTKVDKLAKGSLPLVQINSTVAEVFEVGDSTEDSSVPIIGVAAPRTANSPTIMIHNGNRADNVAEVDAAVLLPGQVYVLIPSNTGQYVPALCVSTPMAELSKDDWYIQQAVNALWDVLENGISRKNEFIKWLPVRDLHINLRKKKEQGKWEDAILGQADAAFIKFTGKDGREVNITVSLKDASGNPLSRETITADLNKFIMDTGKYQGLYTNVDKRKLSDLNYARNMSRYLRVNLPRGLGGQHTMNDGFLYIPTSIEKQHTDGTTVPKTPVETHTTPQGTSKSVVYKGKRYTVDMAGQVFDSKNVPIRGKLAEEIKKAINGATETPTAGVKKPSAKRPTKDPFNTRGGRRKPSAHAKTETEMDEIKKSAIADGTFMKAPNGKPTNLTERQWLQVRTKAFKNWFGDWEIFNKINPYNTNIKLGNPEADINSVDANGFGTIIPVYNNGSYIGEIALNNTYNNGDFVINGSYVSMPEVGNPVELEEEHRGKGYGKAMYFELAKQIANKGKILRSATDSSRTPASTRVWESLVRDGYAKRINDRYEIINSSLSEASKVVDENGEPLVVYHGNRTGEPITSFKKEKLGTEHKERNIKGFWFITDRRIAKEEYALKPESVGKGKEHLEYGEVIPVFLNIRTPVKITQQGIKEEFAPRIGNYTTSTETTEDFFKRAEDTTTENSDGYILTFIDFDNSADDFKSKQTQLVVDSPDQIRIVNTESPRIGSSTNRVDTEDLKTVFDEIQAQKGSDVPVLTALGFLDEQFSYESYVAAMQLMLKIRQIENTPLASYIITKEQYERLGKALSQTTTDKTEVLGGGDILATYKDDIANYETVHVQDLSEYLKARNISMEDYKKLSLEDKISILHCI